MAKLHFIVNPAAGSGASLRAFEKAEALLREKGVEYTFEQTEYPGHATELGRAAAEKNDGRIVVAVGGDGTVKELAEGLVHTGVPMGVLPCGTGNDLIRALCIPLDIEAALTLLLTKDACPVDTCMAGEQFFMNVGGFGFDCDVLVQVERFKANH
ncbi:MAG: acylglycerol kinase family protein, partial [Eubacteriales bacterium]|nr:acylglycerol kinase family protein [Eubacteriales bacterium]